MKLFRLIIKIIALLIILGGVISIYDARGIAKKFFGFGDQNEASTGLKMIGLCICIFGLVIIKIIQ